MTGAEIRSTQPRDRDKIGRMFENGMRHFARTTFTDMDFILFSRLVLVAAQGNNVKGSQISIRSYPSIAWLDGSGVEEGDSEGGVANALLNAFED